MFKKATVLIIIVIFIMGIFIYAETQLYLTQEEKDYIARTDVIKAVTIDGVAPIQYVDSKGEIRGISRRVLEEISDMTGLKFEYKLCNSVEEVYANADDSDIFFGVANHYAPIEMPLSQPFLETKTILYINSALDPNKLDDKIYAAVRGRVNSEEIAEENSVYFDTRKESLDAVERGKADYGYGNAYSVIFYMLKNGYKNIITIPKAKESMEYCIGFLKENDILLSIINKSIDAIDKNKMHALILDETSRIDRKITLSMIIDVYGKKIFVAVFLVMGILLLSVILNIRSNNKLKIQNKRIKMLSQISNEYLYEYFVKSNHLELSEKYIQLFGARRQFNETTNMLKNILLDNDLDGNIPMIKLPLADGRVGTFKSVSLNIHDEKGKVDSIIGKLIDISEDEEEKRKLITKSRTDGLTGLYNAATTKELINEIIKNKNRDRTDVLIVIDCDNLKDINDTYGHLAGDRTLENIGRGLRLVFRQNDIIGRIGGDEFCVYMKNVPSIELVQSKCRQLNKVIQELNKDFYVSVSSGIALLKEKSTYEDLFEKADRALYKVKGKGRL